jgi:ferredoxin
MAPPHRCNCGKSSCFTCHRRIVNERYRMAAPKRRQPRDVSREVSDAELDRRALILMGRPTWNA